MKKTYCNLTGMILLFLLTAFNSVIYAQQSIDFTFKRTGPNHSVLALPIWHPVIKTLQENDSIPSEVVLGFEGDSLETGDLVGVFYTNQSGDFKCAGSLQWKSNDFNMLPVWGQDPPGSDNGMEMGERMIWLAQKSDNKIYEIEPTYQKPLMAIYIKDGASALLGMKLKKSETLIPAKNIFE